MMSYEIDDAYIEFAADQAAGELAVKQLCKRVLPGWANLNEDDLTISRISGGISNQLVKVAPPTDGAGSSLRPVAVKVFGEKTELLVDREAELQNLVKLGSAGFGPKLLAVFGNGRVEEFLNVVTLKPEDMLHGDYVPRIARRLRQLHSVDPGTPSPGLVFGTIQGWLDMAKELSFDDEAKAARFQQVDLAQMQQELSETRRMCEAINSPVVFAHNDLLSGNILVLQADGVDATDRSKCDLTGPLQFIDFEYSTAGYRGFDWGNHFNEYAGFECDYTRYPDAAAQALFFRHYMADDTPAAGVAQQQGPELQPADLSQEQLERLSAEANLFALASHCYWGIWALIQARYSPIEFDYLEYSLVRWKEYHRRKAEYVAAARKFWDLQ